MNTRSFLFRRAVSVCGALTTCAAVSLASAHAQQSTNAAPQHFTRATTGPVVNLLGTLLNEAGTSYIIGPGVTGDVSVHFADLPLNTALDRIAQSFSPPLSVMHLKDGTVIIRAGEKGPTRLALSTPPSTVTVQQAQPPSGHPISVSVAGGDPVAIALELQIINLRVEREAAAAMFSPQRPEIRTLDVQIAALEEQLAIHKAAKTVSAKPVKTAQAMRRPK